uniref:Uncharacterized protein n=1 Tax=Pleurocladia lacustris TaxID=246121 RepID=A0A1I9LWA1_9PHAE|nr:hypothetical protein [Pleurocladia lacustris]ANS57829.1 hypothetical protein [Pleurocladia lacustris]ANS57871.1 hypothetical protein [Pleurocladia lacustris]
MFTPRKRYLRKKRFFLPKQHTFALFNGSNLKTSTIIKIKLSLHKQNANLYSIPLFLAPPKVAIGYPLIMIIYNNLEDLQANLTKIPSEIDCIGLSINKKWYPIISLKNTNITNSYLNKKFLALLLLLIKD